MTMYNVKGIVYCDKTRVSATLSFSSLLWFYGSFSVFLISLVSSSSCFQQTSCDRHIKLSSVGLPEANLPNGESETPSS